ncbi:MAG: putative PEP-binding protein [Spirochaetia bacterium]|nr:putative PEP-binding protein [Spirochaetia bacterium]
MREKNEEVVTLDNKSVRVGASAGSLSDTKLAYSYGADHIGLLRTEYTFSGDREFPGEEEQTSRYTEIVELLKGKPVTIRTFDAGGDKHSFFGTQQKDSNPYLGQRAIRLALRFEHSFRAQIRAILKSSVHGPVKLLIPLVTTVNEIKSVLSILNEEKNTLKKRGESYDPGLPIGIMLEVPSALFILPKLLQYIDFVTIGINDFTQYILAADRNNPKVSALYSPVEPSVLIAVQQAVQTCRRAGTAVNICGEAVSHPEYLRFLLAMEPDEVNMYPQAVPLIKESIRHSSVEREKALLSKALSCEGSNEIETLIF